MLVYRDESEEVVVAARLADLAAQARALVRACDAELACELLIEIGAVESAVADDASPEVDDLAVPEPPIALASLAAGRLLHATRRLGPEAARAQAVQLARTLASVPPHPATLTLKQPEGYAYYAVYPEAYMQAAEQFVSRTAAPTVICLGLRSIGASLSAAVAGTVAAAGRRVLRYTLRPRGHPFAREPRLTPRLAEHFRQQRAALFLIIDEGPGLSGSSLAGTAEALARLGIDENHIVIMPAHLPDPCAFRSAAARARWLRHRKAQAGFETAILPGMGLAQGQDLGGGAWRAMLPPGRAWPAVQPQHERRKYLTVGHDGRPILHKFVGLGRPGRLARARAVLLAEAGFAPPVLDLRQGFLSQPWLRARPLPLGRPSAAFQATGARYLRFIGETFARPHAVDHAPLLTLIRANVGEALGAEALVPLAGLERHPRSFGERPAVAIDGRMLRHEWLLTAAGHRKTDGVDHHADHFQPGCTDLAWDVAGFSFEHGLRRADQDALATFLGDPGLTYRLPFFHLAYLAARLGYAELAAESLAGTADGLRMARQARRYRRALPAAIAALAAVLPGRTSGWLKPPGDGGGTNGCTDRLPARARPRRATECPSTG